MQSHVLSDMLPFVPDGRECLTQGEKRGAILMVGAVESERTARRRLIVVDLIAVNFRRRERLHRDDPLLRVMRKMKSVSVITADESRAKFAAVCGRQRCGDETMWRRYG